MNTDVCEIWADNAPVFDLFAALDTQWRMGASMPVGLDYNAAGLLMDISGVPHEQRMDMLSDLRIMERAALTQMSEDRKSK